LPAPTVVVQTQFATPPVLAPTSVAAAADENKAASAPSAAPAYTIRYACPHCGERLAAAPQLVGRDFVCSRCGGLSIVPMFSEPDRPQRERANPTAGLAVAIAALLLHLAAATRAIATDNSVVVLVVTNFAAVVCAGLGTAMRGGSLWYGLAWSFLLSPLAGIIHGLVTTSGPMHDPHAPGRRTGGALYGCGCGLLVLVIVLAVVMGMSAAMRELDLQRPGPAMQAEQGTGRAAPSDEDQADARVAPNDISPSSTTARRTRPPSVAVELADWRVDTQRDLERRSIRVEVRDDPSGVVIATLHLPGMANGSDQTRRLAESQARSLATRVPGRQVRVTVVDATGGAVDQAYAQQSVR
jgi:Na+-transporting methylmalonyl-CoA/oxaloacetate decarboxylase gamma subunit